MSNAFLSYSMLQVMGAIEELWCEAECKAVAFEDGAWYTFETGYGKMLYVRGGVGGEEVQCDAEVRGPGSILGSMPG